VLDAADLPLITPVRRCRDCAQWMQAGLSGVTPGWRLCATPSPGQCRS